MNRRVHKPIFAIGFFVSNLVIMVLISGLVKQLADYYPVHQILFFRFAFAVLPLFLLMVFTLGIGSMKTNRVKDHAIRSVSGVVSISLFFYAISLIPLAEATMLSYSSPIFITLLSIPVLAEKIGFRRWFAVIAGFIGVVIITQPGFSIFGIGSLFAIASAMMAAIVVVWLRLLSDTEQPTTTSIIYNGLGAAVFAVWLMFSGWTVVGSLVHWGLLVAIGLFASVQQFMFAVAFRYGEASMLAPFEYLILVFSAVAGYLFWHEIPSLTSIIGGVVICVSGLVIALRSSRSRIIQPRRI